MTIAVFPIVPGLAAVLKMGFRPEVPVARLVLDREEIIVVGAFVIRIVANVIVVVHAVIDDNLVECDLRQPRERPHMLKKAVFALEKDLAADGESAVHGWIAASLRIAPVATIADESRLRNGATHELLALEDAVIVAGYIRWSARVGVFEALVEEGSWGCIGFSVLAVEGREDYR